MSGIVFGPVAPHGPIAVCEACTEDELELAAATVGVDPVDFVERAAADSWWQMLMLHGALGNGLRSELRSYEVPSYYGMLCATFTRGP